MYVRRWTTVRSALRWARAICRDSSDGSSGARSWTASRALTSSTLRPAPTIPPPAASASPTPLAENYHPLSQYLYCAANPLANVDPDGRKTILYATNLPDSYSVLAPATHTFIAVINEDGSLRKYFAYGESDNGELKLMEYRQDKNVIAGIDEEHLKAKIEIPVPEGMTQSEFDDKIIETAKSFGNNPDIKYRITAVGMTNGNCNSSTSTILLKSGVSKEDVEKIGEKIPGITWGVSTDPKPWTSKEQKEAVEADEFLTRMVKERETLTR